MIEIRLSRFDKKERRVEEIAMRSKRFNPRDFAWNLVEALKKFEPVGWQPILRQVLAFAGDELIPKSVHLHVGPEGSHMTCASCGQVIIPNSPIGGTPRAVPVPPKKGAPSTDEVLVYLAAVPNVHESALLAEAKRRVMVHDRVRGIVAACVENPRCFGFSSADVHHVLRILDGELT